MKIKINELTEKQNTLFSSRKNGLFESYFRFIRIKIIPF